MIETDWLTEAFTHNRPRLRAVAYRMLGSLAEADDAVQEAWLRASRAETTGVDNPAGWLTTIVSRVCLNALRARNARREQPLDVHLPDPIISTAEGTSPEDEALLADSVGLALQVVLDTLAPRERLAFVLHDVFGLPFDEIAPIVERSPAAARQLASRARRQVRGAGDRVPEPDLARQREVVDAFFAAAHGGDFDALVAILDPQVLFRCDGGLERADLSGVVRGAEVVAGQALAIALPTAPKRPVLVNGAAGVVISLDERPVAVLGFTVCGGRIVEIDAIIDPQRVSRLDTREPV